MRPGREARMNLYHCMIDLKDDAKALAFAQALGAWMDCLKGRGADLPPKSSSSLR
jgi:hypothetical protein